MYQVRVDVANVRYVTVDDIKGAFSAAGINWAGQWTVRNVILNDDLLDEDQQSTPVAEPEAIEGLRAETKSYSVGRNRRLRDLALKKARGVCCVCDVDYREILDGNGVRVLQVHHRKQLAANDAPVVTCLSDLAVVCANCHMLIHMNPKQAFSVEELRLMLGKSSGAKSRPKSRLRMTA
jgi:predicted HNH restriction endonuclease